MVPNLVCVANKGTCNRTSSWFDVAEFALIVPSVVICSPAATDVAKRARLDPSVRTNFQSGTRHCEV
eukprot:6258451-Amphidinium_carterae.1